MLTEQWFRDNPFETQPLPDGRLAWFDPDLNKFLVGSANPDGCDDAQEFDNFGDIS